MNKAAITEESQPLSAVLAPESEAERRQRQAARKLAAIQLLRAWREEDAEGAQEQRETWEFLKQALDDDRLSYRKLFAENEDGGTE